MSRVRAKKHLGQHFLKDERIAEKVAAALSGAGYDLCVEVGPGMGILTQFLLKRPWETWLVELDRESVSWLQAHHPALSGRLLNEDFLKWDPSKTFGDKPFAVVGNFPYNISSQIVFKVLEERERVPEMAGMFQHEVAERIASGPGSRDYGILSVLTQTYYEVSYLFTVEPEVFDPPPKVKSGVIVMRRKPEAPDVSYIRLKTVVKTAFNQRRKTLRNALKSLNFDPGADLESLMDKRAEQLSPLEFERLTNAWQA